MIKRNELEREWQQFSDRAVNAVDRSEIDAVPFVNLLEHTFAIARGVDTILQIVTGNQVLGDMLEDEDEDLPAPLSGCTVDALQRFARVSMQMLMSEIERVSIWADERAGKIEE